MSWRNRQNRRAFIRNAGLTGVFSLSGCLNIVPGGDTEGESGSQVFRKIEPEQTRGDPARISPSTSIEQGLIDAISNRLDCRIDDIDVHAHNPGHVITITSTVPPIENTNVYFPPRGYDILKNVAPRKVTKELKDELNQSPVSEPIYIRAILREGPEQETAQLIGENCTIPDR